MQRPPEAKEVRAAIKFGWANRMAECFIQLSREFLKGEEKMYSLRSKLLTIVSIGTMIMMLVGCAAPAQSPTTAPAATQAQATAAPAATQAQAVVTLKYHTW